MGIGLSAAGVNLNRLPGQCVCVCVCVCVLRYSTSKSVATFASDNLCVNLNNTECRWCRLSVAGHVCCVCVCVLQ